MVPVVERRQAVRYFNNALREQRSPNLGDGAPSLVLGIPHHAKQDNTQEEQQDGGKNGDGGDGADTEGQVGLVEALHETSPGGRSGGLTDEPLQPAS